MLKDPYYSTFFRRLTYYHRLLKSRVRFFSDRALLCIVTVFAATNFGLPSLRWQFVPFVDLLIVDRSLFNCWFGCVSCILFLRFAFSVHLPILILIFVGNLAPRLPPSPTYTCVQSRSYSISNFARFFIGFQAIPHICYKDCEPAARFTLHTLDSVAKRRSQYQFFAGKAKSVINHLRVIVGLP